MSSARNASPWRVDRWAHFQGPGAAPVSDAIFLALPNAFSDEWGGVGTWSAHGILLSRRFVRAFLSSFAIDAPARDADRRAPLIGDRARPRPAMPFFLHSPMHFRMKGGGDSAHPRHSPFSSGHDSFLDERGGNWDTHSILLSRLADRASPCRSSGASHCEAMSWSPVQACHFFEEYPSFLLVETSISLKTIHQGALFVPLFDTSMKIRSSLASIRKETSPPAGSTARPRASA